ncbi:hypothetical protein TSUD_20140 [Trifolium subterraneum]|uniref:BZIP domain-containing protein n=2 Tax=Trifolium TaxID=3898 RepID=A0A2Z6MPL3_TRISU|nr:hypothetical protein TSUD_20140 [Trifolium subterraneum]
MEEQLDWECFFDQLPDFEQFKQVGDFFQEDVINPPVSIGETPSPIPSLSEIENLLMTDSDEGIASPEDSEFDKLLADFLIEPVPQSEEGSMVHSDKDRVDSSSPEEVPSDKDGVDSSSPEEVPSDKDSVDPSTPEEVSPEPVSKKQIRQMRNRDAAVKSRERKKMYVKNLETKSRYFEGECRRLEHLLQCCYAENHALRFCLQSRGAFGAPMTMQESAVLLLDVKKPLGILVDFSEQQCWVYSGVRRHGYFANVKLNSHRQLIPAAGFPAMVHGHHVATQSTPPTVANSVTSKRKHGTQRSKKGDSKKAKQ